MHEDSASEMIKGNSTEWTTAAQTTHFEVLRKNSNHEAGQSGIFMTPTPMHSKWPGMTLTTAIQIIDQVTKITQMLRKS